MSGCAPYGKCEVCGKEGNMTRTVYEYDIKGGYHDENHMEEVWHCVNCKPQAPEYIKVMLKGEKLLINKEDSLSDEEYMKQRIEKFIARGKEVLRADKIKLWSECVPIRLEDLYKGFELDCLLRLEEILKTKTPDCYKLASEELHRQGHSGMSIGLMRSMVHSFCTNGPDFAEKHMK